MSVERDTGDSIESERRASADPCHSNGHHFSRSKSITDSFKLNRKSAAARSTSGGIISSLKNICDNWKQDYALRFVIVIALALLLIGVFVVFCFTGIVNFIIDKQIALTEGSQTFDMWRKPPVHPVMRVYIYNVTNADDFLNDGRKPILQELGPYVYEETWEKVNLQFHENGTLTFNQQKIFKFDAENSVGSEDDMVVIPNIPMLSATSQSKHAARFLRLAMASIMDILKIKPFVEVSVGQLLWGYEDPLLKLAKDVVPKEQKLPYEEFGLLYGLEYIVDTYAVTTMNELLNHLQLPRLMQGLGSIIISAITNNPRSVISKIPKRHYSKFALKHKYVFGLLLAKNGTAADNVTIFTGAEDITKFGLINRFNGKPHMTHWKTDFCNRIDGSDGSVFPPHMNHNTTIYVYDKDLCRLLPLKFQKEVITHGDVKGYRFSPPKDVFADVAINPDNDCFCPSGPPCTPHGMFNVSLCQYDSPILLSFPHFYLGDDKYRTAVEGISPPNASHHEFFIDVQPEMGVSLRAKARLQINLAVSQVVDIKQVATFPDIVFPIMWFEDGIDKLPENVTELMKLATEAPAVAKVALSYTLFIVGTVLLVISVFCLVRSSSRQETMSLEGTAHYTANDEINKKKKAAMNGHTNGKTIDSKVNPAFVGDNVS